MADCKCMQDEICVNADCPMYADYCPVPDTEGLCRFEDRGDENAEYIERETIYADFEKCNAENPKWTPNRVKSLIARQPAADVAPVVHCCDCKHLSVYNTKDVYAWCRKIGFTFLPFETDTRTHFCGFGERMDGDG